MITPVDFGAEVLVTSGPFELLAGHVVGFNDPYVRVATAPPAKGHAWVLPGDLVALITSPDFE